MRNSINKLAISSFILKYMVLVVDGATVVLKRGGGLEGFRSLSPSSHHAAAARPVSGALVVPCNNAQVSIWVNRFNYVLDALMYKARL